MNRQYGCVQGVRVTRYGHYLSKYLLNLAVDGRQRLDATMYLRYTMSLSCVFNITVVVLLSQVAWKDNAGDICRTNPGKGHTNILARVHFKQPRREFFVGGVVDYSNTIFNTMLISRTRYAISSTYSLVVGNILYGKRHTSRTEPVLGQAQCIGLKFTPTPFFLTRCLIIWMHSSTRGTPQKRTQKISLHLLVKLKIGRVLPPLILFSIELPR